jgi:hypothetical protein
MSRNTKGHRRTARCVTAAGIALCLVLLGASSTRNWIFLDSANGGDQEIHYTIPASNVSEYSKTGMTLRATNKRSTCVHIRYNLDYSYRYITDKTEMRIHPGGISVNANSQNYSFISYPNVSDVSLTILRVTNC